MNSRPVWITVLLLLAGVAVLVFALPEAMLSPGRMLKGHEALETDCFACHVPMRGSQSDKCIACHAVDRIGRFTTTGQPLSATRPAFHQQLIEPDCMACHAEHRGQTVRDAEKPFSHELLKGDVREKCASCHLKPKDDLHDKLGDSCQACHMAGAWRPATFEHAKYFLLDHDHNVDCVTCHVGGDLKRYTCYGCHEHSPARVREKHIKEGIRRFENCVECHRSPSEPEEGERHKREN